MSNFKDLSDEQLAATLKENIDRVEDLMNEASDRGLYTDLDLRKLDVSTSERGKFLHSISLTLERREPVSPTTQK